MRAYIEKVDDRMGEFLKIAIPLEGKNMHLLAVLKESLVFSDSHDPMLGSIHVALHHGEPEIEKMKPVDLPEELADFFKTLDSNYATAMQ